MSGAALKALIAKELLPQEDSAFAALLPEDDGAAQAMDVSPDVAAAAPEDAHAAAAVARTPSLEVEVRCRAQLLAHHPPTHRAQCLLHLFTVIRLVDDKRYADAASCATALVDKVKSFLRPTLNPIAAKAYFYYSRAHELVGGAQYAAIRSTLLAAHRTASLQHASEAQLTIVNLLLRNYLHHSLYDQADKLASKSEQIATMLVDGSVSNNQIARFLHYQGHIKAVQLAYGAAFDYLEEALRKAPRGTARGFHIATYKLLTIVQLLMGEIPERAVFRQEELAVALRPYLLLAKAVRVGNLEAYNAAVAKHHDALSRDGTLTLVVRLRHNVIKTGLRKINAAYSRIKFDAIAHKLRLESAKDSEYIVAKAIRDGVVDATIHHSQSYMESQTQADVYSTTEPYEQFHKRTEFCIKIRNDAVRAMQFHEAEERKEVLKEEAKEGGDKKDEGAVDVDNVEDLDLDEED